jgi:hypothetical protein
MGAENLPPPEFDPRTVQPVASRYTDFAKRFICCLEQAYNDLPRYNMIRRDLLQMKCVKCVVSGGVV